MAKIRFLLLLLCMSTGLYLVGCTPPNDDPDINVDIKQPADGGPPTTTTTTTGN